MENPMNREKKTVVMGSMVKQKVAANWLWESAGFYTFFQGKWSAIGPAETLEDLPASADQT